MGENTRVIGYSQEVRVKAPRPSSLRKAGLCVKRLFVIDIELRTVVTRGDCDRIVVEGLQV